VNSAFSIHAKRESSGPAGSLPDWRPTVYEGVQSDLGSEVSAMLAYASGPSASPDQSASQLFGQDWQQQYIPQASSPQETRPYSEMSVDVVEPDVSLGQAMRPSIGYPAYTDHSATSSLPFAVYQMSEQQVHAAGWSLAADSASSAATNGIFTVPNLDGLSMETSQYDSQSALSPAQHNLMSVPKLNPVNGMHPEYFGDPAQIERAGMSGLRHLTSPRITSERRRSQFSNARTRPTARTGPINKVTKPYRIAGRMPDSRGLLDDSSLSRRTAEATSHPTGGDYDLSFMYSGDWDRSEEIDFKPLDAKPTITYIGQMMIVNQVLEGIFKLPDIEKRPHCTCGWCRWTVVTADKVHEPTRSDYKFLVDQQHTQQIRRIMQSFEIWLVGLASVDQQAIFAVPANDLRSALAHLIGGDYIGSWKRSSGRGETSRGADTCQMARWMEHRQKRYNDRSQTRQRLQSLTTAFERWLTQPREQTWSAVEEGDFPFSDIGLLQKSTQGFTFLARHLEDLKPWK
jgi:hypothetical protein